LALGRPTRIPAPVAGSKAGFGNDPFPGAQLAAAFVEQMPPNWLGTVPCVAPRMGVTIPAV